MNNVITLETYRKTSAALLFKFSEVLMKIKQEKDVLVKSVLAKTGIGLIEENEKLSLKISHLLIITFNGEIKKAV